MEGLGEKAPIVYLKNTEFCSLKIKIKIVTG